MANLTKFGGAVAITTLESTSLNALGSGSRVLGTTAYDNSANLNLYGIFELVATSTAAMTANGTIDLYIIPSIDGTNYIGGSNTVVPQPDLYYGSFIVQATTSQRLALMPGINAPLKMLPPTLFKVLLWNQSGQPLLSANTLKMVAMNLNNNA